MHVLMRGGRIDGRTVSTSLVCTRGPWAAWGDKSWKLPRNAVISNKSVRTTRCVTTGALTRTRAHRGAASNSGTRTPRRFAPCRACRFELDPCCWRRTTTTYEVTRSRVTSTLPLPWRRAAPCGRARLNQRGTRSRRPSRLCPRRATPSPGATRGTPVPSTARVPSPGATRGRR